MPDNTQSWKLDLDSDEFLDKAVKAKESIQGIGDAENLTGLVKGLIKAGEGLAAVGVAVLALKTSFDLVFDAEQIEAVNAQFVLLTKNSGIATDKLREGLRETANGLIGETDLLQIANKAIVEMGASAEKLPQLMELARKSTAVMGGDLATNFTNLANAIAMGNQRMLKHAGIIVDVNKAQREFAASQGVALSALSESGKQQALLNAVLEKGRQDLKNVDADLKVATNAWQEFKTAMSEIGESFALLYDKTMGPSVKGITLLIKDAAQATRDWLIKDFGDGAESTKLQLKEVSEEMNRLASDLLAKKEKLAHQGEKGFWGHFFELEHTDEIEKSISQMTKRFEDLRTERNRLLNGSQDKNAEGSGDSPIVKQSIVDLDKVRKLNTKFEADMLQLRQKRLGDELKYAQSVQVVDENLAQRKTLLAQQTANKIKQINQDNDKSPAQRHALILEEQRNLDMRLKDLDEDLYNERIKALDNYESHSKGVADSIGRTWSAETKKASLDLERGTTVGKQAYDSLSGAAFNSMQAIGDSSQDAAGAVKKNLLGGLSDFAFGYGKTMFLAALAGTPPLFIPNAGGMAAGLGLMAFSGVLKGLAGGGGGSSASTGGGGGGGASSSAATVAAPAQSAPQSNNYTQTKQSQLNINVQGSIFDSDQTGRRLVDLIRGQSDQADYRVLQIGQQ